MNITDNKLPQEDTQERFEKSMPKCEEGWIIYWALEDARDETDKDALPNAWIVWLNHWMNCEKCSNKE